MWQKMRGRQWSRRGQRSRQGRRCARLPAWGPSARRKGRGRRWSWRGQRSRRGRRCARWPAWGPSVRWKGRGRRWSRGCRSRAPISSVPVAGKYIDRKQKTRTVSELGTYRPRPRGGWVFGLASCSASSKTRSATEELGTYQPRPRPRVGWVFGLASRSASSTLVPLMRNPRARHRVLSSWRGRQILQMNLQ